MLVSFLVFLFYYIGCPFTYAFMLYHVNTWYLYCGVVFIFICCLLTRLVYWNSQKITKKRKSITSAVCCFFLYFGMNEIIFMLMFLSMHVVNFMFWICMLGIWNSQWLITRKRGSVEILAQSSISSESQTKVNFKVTASR